MAALVTKQLCDEIVIRVHRADETRQSLNQLIPHHLRGEPIRNLPNPKTKKKTKADDVG